MSDHPSFRVQKTDTGYVIVVRDAEAAVIVIDGHRIGVSFEPDDDDEPVPLDVQLA